MEPRERIDVPSPTSPKRPGAGVALVRVALQRRLAERTFEDYVREMARRWDRPPAGGAGPTAAPPEL